MTNEFKCPDLFFGNETAYATVHEDRVSIKMWWFGEYMEFDMCIDKISGFLDQCRHSQQAQPK